MKDQLSTRFPISGGAWGARLHVRKMEVNLTSVYEQMLVGSGEEDYWMSNFLQAMNSYTDIQVSLGRRDWKSSSCYSICGQLLVGTWWSTSRVPTKPNGAGHGLTGSASSASTLTKSSHIHCQRNLILTDCSVSTWATQIKTSIWPVGKVNPFGGDSESDLSGDDKWRQK